MPTLTVRAVDTDGTRVTISRLTVRLQRTGRIVHQGAPARLSLERGIYLLTVESTAYRRAQRFVQLLRSTVVPVMVLVKPDHVRAVFDPFPYPFDVPDTLSDLRRACLQNLLTKIAVTPVVCHAVEGFRLRRIKRDRMWVDVPPSLRPSVLAHQAFRSVSGALHPPPTGYALAGSVKTHDTVAGLQLTFFAADGLPDVLEVDIDNHSGIAHVRDVATHTITGNGTHPYDIREALVVDQGLYPGYKLVPI